MKVTPAGRLRRTLVWYSFGTACCVALVIGVLLVVQDHGLTGSEVSSSIGLNLIGSVVFAIMFALLANWVQDRNVQETISEGFSELTGQIMQTMASTNRLFLPAKRYDALNPTSSFGDDYNRDVTREMPESYRFNKDSFSYSTFWMDLMRKFEISANQVKFESGHDDAFLIDHLNTLTGRTITDTDLERWRAEQRKDSATFRGYLAKMYGDLNHPKVAPVVS